VAQLRGSVCVLVQSCALHDVKGGGHWHVPPEQVSFATVQAIPQPPQLAGSFCVSAQRGIELGQEVPPVHWQVPLEQVPCPHAIPQPPQFAGSDA
jgi:hypothetical protein